MAKKTKPRPQQVPAHATAERYNGGAIKLELLLQPQDAAKLIDQLVNALVADDRDR